LTGGVLRHRRDGETGVCAWAANGAAAVVGACILMIIMVYYGSTQTFLVGSLACLGALIFRRPLGNSGLPDGLLDQHASHPRHEQ